MKQGMAWYLLYLYESQWRGRESLRWQIWQKVQWDFQQKNIEKAFVDWRK